MAKFDRMSSIFWIGIALAICEESLRIGVGSLSNPGSGLVPLGCGLILMVFGSIVLLRAFKRDREEKEFLWKEDTRPIKIISVVVSIFGYALLVDFLGFHLVTFLWVGYLCWKIGDMRWKEAAFASAVTTFLSYLVFERFLQLHFPKGILSF